MEITHHSVETTPYKAYEFVPKLDHNAPCSEITLFQKRSMWPRLIENENQCYLDSLLPSFHLDFDKYLWLMIQANTRGIFFRKLFEEKGSKVICMIC